MRVPRASRVWVGGQWCCVVLCVDHMEGRHVSMIHDPLKDKGWLVGWGVCSFRGPTHHITHSPPNPVSWCVCASRGPPSFLPSFLPTSFRLPSDFLPSFPKGPMDRPILRPLFVASSDRQPKKRVESSRVGWKDVKKRTRGKKKGWCVGVCDRGRVGRAPGRDRDRDRERVVFDDTEAQRRNLLQDSLLDTTHHTPQKRETERDDLSLDLIV